MDCFARFEEIAGHLFRFDTRIYLETFDRAHPSVCVAAIVGKNPGSALPSKLGRLLPLELHGDKMLPSVANRFLNAYRLAHKRILPNSFIRVWNLFYVCGSDLSAALEVALNVQRLPICRSEHKLVSIVWFGWGDNHERLNQFKCRFLDRRYQVQFFYDKNNAAIVNRAPTISDFAKHTQGMPAKPVEAYLASVL